MTPVANNTQNCVNSNNHHPLPPAQFVNLGFTIVDLGISSVGNFATWAVSAHVLGVPGLGRLAIIYTVMMLGLRFSNAAVCVPMAVELGSNPAVARQATTSALIYAAALSAAWWPIMIYAAYLAKCSSVLAPLSAMLGLQLQDVTRRALLISPHPSAALIGDAFSFILQPIAIVWLAKDATHPVSTILYCMAATSGIALAIQIKQLACSLLAVPSLFVRIASYWNAGKWVCVTALCDGLPVQLSIFALGATGNFVASGELQTILTATGMMNPVLFAIGTRMVPEITGGNLVGGNKEAYRRGGTLALKGLGLMCGILIIFEAATPKILNLISGKQDTLLIPQARLFGFVPLILLGVYVVLAAANAFGKAYEGMLLQLLLTALSLPIVLLGLFLFGLRGVIGGSVVSSVIALAVAGVVGFINVSRAFQPKRAAN